MKKKKGNALILSLCVITILITFSSILVSQAVAAYNFTLRNEKKDKLSLLAESGIEKGLIALKQKIYNTPDIFDSDIPFDPDDFEFTDENTKTSVSFEYINDYIENGASLGPGVKIISHAKNNITNLSKTIKAYILKRDISNIYYDTLFGNVISTLDVISGNNAKSFYMQDSKNPLILDGSMYLQGGDIDIKPYSLDYRSGRININAKKLTTIRNDNLVGKMYVNPSTQIDPGIASKVKKITPSYLPILAVKYNIPADAQLQNFYEGNSYTNPNRNYTVMAARQTTIEDGKEVTTLVTFKITKNNMSVTSSFDWSSFVKDVKDFIMRNMIKINGRGFIGTPNGNYYGTDFEEAYKGMYKLYIVDGDVSIKTPRTTSSYINHVVYSTGKCTLGRGDNPYINFSNSSIMAKQVYVEDLTTYRSRNKLELHGIRKVGEGLINGLSPFSRGNRAAINKFLIQHLDGYADALRFKVHKWEES